MGGLRVASLRMDEGELEIEYPCRWEYRLIGKSEAQLRAAAAGALGEAQHELRPSKKSGAGTYVSMSLQVDVCDEAQRKHFFARLSAHADVLYVL